MLDRENAIQSLNNKLNQLEDKVFSIDIKEASFCEKN